MFKKLSLSFLTLTFLMTGVFLFVDAVKGATVSPEDNVLCWTKKKCEEINKGGFVIDDVDCGGFAKENDATSKYGKCLAGAKTVTQVSFGGTDYKTFNNIGDYIKTIYNYALIIISILASIMIIVAGIQYIGSAGNQEIISSSKKRIISSLIGLALAFMSYTILNMINPSTVSLRLPQVYMLRPEKIALSPGDFCDLKNAKEIAACAENTEGGFKYYCSQMGKGESCGLGSDESCACTKAAQIMANTVIMLTMGGGEALVNTAGNIIAKRTLASTMSSVGEGAIALKSAGTNPIVFESTIETVMLAATAQGKQVAKSAVELAVKEATKSNSLIGVIKMAGNYIWTGGKVTMKGTGKAIEFVAGKTASVVSSPAVKVTALTGEIIYVEDAIANAVRNAYRDGDISPGVCIAAALEEGQLCDLKQAGCKLGRCIEYPGLGSIGCWAGGQIGVCSSGKVNSFCNSNDDCDMTAAPKGCVAFTEIGGNDIKACSDGSLGSPCSKGDNNICKSKKCENGYCIRANANMTIGSLCQDNNYCNIGKCYNLAPITVVYNNKTEQFSFSGEKPIVLDKSEIRKDVGNYSFKYNYNVSDGVCLENLQDINNYRNSLYSYWEGEINNLPRSFNFDGSIWGD